jgi:hypothetical protein
MCDDYYDDFGGDYDGESEDYGDGGFEDSDPCDGDAPALDADDGPWDSIKWQDWMIIGPLSEEIAREKREEDRISREKEDHED